MIPLAVFITVIIYMLPHPHSYHPYHQKPTPPPPLARTIPLEALRSSNGVILLLTQLILNPTYSSLGRTHGTSSWFSRVYSYGNQNIPLSGQW